MNEFILTSTVNDLILARWDLKLLQAKMQAMIDAQAAQQARQPLTEDRIAEISVACAAVTPSDIYFARQIERAHGIGGEE